MNALLWRLPMPSRMRDIASAVIHRNPPIQADLVVAVIDALGVAGVRCWIRGGWGVDALAGRQSRRHDDLDLIIEQGGQERAVRALEALGFRERYRVDSDRPLFSRIVLRDHPTAGHTVDLQPLDISSSDLRFATGVIDGRQVPCMSIESQIATHSNYRLRGVDREDLRVLRALVDADRRGGGSEP